MMDPRVSVILPVYNRERSVARAITSVLSQTHRPQEVIVVDDGSTDGTRRVLDGFGSLIRVLEQPHMGAYAARNLGSRHAKGDLLAFVDSDDVSLPDRFECQVPLMCRPEVGLVFGDAIHVTSLDRGARPTGATCFQVSPPRRGRVADHFIWCNFVPTTTVLVRRRCLEEVGGFSEACALSVDYLTWFRIALRHELDYVERPVAEYAVHADGLSHHLGRALAARIQLFANELERTSDPATRAVLRQLLFNLALHLALAIVRRRARKLSDPLRLAWRTAATVAGVEAGPWTAAFAVNQVRVRTQRRRA